MLSKRWIVLSVVAVTLLAASVFVFGSSKHASAAPTLTLAPEVRSVRVQEAHPSTEAAEQTFTGTVHARYESDLGFRVGGKIVERLVELGGRVRRGQTLARLDPGDMSLSLKAAEADLAAAEAALTQAQIDFDRITRLTAANALAPADLDRVRAERDGAEARRERARAVVRLSANRLGYCTLTADADGVVTSLPVEVGQVVEDGQLVARLARSGALEAVVSIPENRINLVRQGKASVTFWSQKGPSLPALLRELSPTADPVTRTYTARFTIQKPSTDIALGMTATVHVGATLARNGLSLPLSSIYRQDDTSAIWVVDRASGHLRLTPVNVLQYRQETVLVAGDVKEGDLVVTAGVQKLDAGMTVRPLLVQR